MYLLCYTEDTIIKGALEMKKNRILRLAAMLMVVFMGLGMAAQAEEMQLGNDIAGYMTTELDFYPFISVDIPEETRLQLEKDMGYCRFTCSGLRTLSGSP